MSKELKAFRKICNNLNNYEFTDEYRENRNLIETALENYEKLTSKPVILYGRTHGHTQALIDTICKNYKEVKITNLEDEKKLKALEIIKEFIRIGFITISFKEKQNFGEDETAYYVFVNGNQYRCKTKEEYDLLKEVLK